MKDRSCEDGERVDGTERTVSSLGDNSCSDLDYPLVAERAGGDCEIVAEMSAVDGLKDTCLFEVEYPQKIWDVCVRFEQQWDVRVPFEQQMGQPCGPPAGPPRAS